MISAFGVDHGETVEKGFGELATKVGTHLGTGLGRAGGALRNAGAQRVASAGGKGFGARLGRAQVGLGGQLHKLTPGVLGNARGVGYGTMGAGAGVLGAGGAAAVSRRQQYR